MTKKFTKEYVCIQKGLELLFIERYKAMKVGILKANKTMYIQVSNDSKLVEVEAYADEIATRLGNVGKIESFIGPIRPHLQVGDYATIIGENGLSKDLGIITEVGHSFGKSGFNTSFTVDSGGRLGKGSLSGYIKKIATGDSGKSTSKGNNDIDREEYGNIAKYARLSASSEYSPRYNVGRLVDGVMALLDDGYIGWRPDKTEQNPFVLFDFQQRVAIDKIDLYLGVLEDSIARGPHWYKIQYWNGSFG